MIDNGICKRFTKVFGLSEFSVTVTAAAAARETAAALSRILSAARPAMAVLAVLMLIFSTAGCQKEAGVVPAGQGANSRMRDLSTVMVPSNRMGLFADLSRYDHLGGAGQTKSSDSEVVDLESLLDRSRTKRDTVNGQIYTQIPFLENGSSVMVCVREEPGAVFEQVTEVKKYYIELRPEEGEGLLQYVATMLISPKGYEGNPRFDFLNKGNVDGVMILSTLRGKVFEVVEYSEGMVRHARLVSPDADGDVAAGTRYAYVYNRGAVTKGESDEDGTRHDGEIVAAYCIAKRPKSEELEIDWKMYWINNYIEEEESGGDGDMGSAPGSEGGSGDYTYWQPEPDGPKYTIELSCNVPEHVEMVGSGGPYPRGQRVVIGYQMRSVPWYSEFKYWSGDFSGQSEACFLHILESDVKATAWFDVNPPCRDKARMVMNPLNDMRVAATVISYRGGTFGNTRVNASGAIKRHNGLDLAAELGTPIYAMYDGVITEAVSDAPDKFDRNSPLGNTLWIESTVQEESGDEVTLTVLYAHLNYGTPFAVNPRTGQPFEAGDEVYQGDMIGYTGRTGNAYNVPNYHLHLGVKIDGAWVDPISYINGSYVLSELGRTAGRINNIKCD